MNFQAFFNALPVIGKGMLGIFVVTGVIIFVMVALNFLTRKPKTED